MLACKQVVGNLGRVSKRCLATHEVPLPAEFEALFDVGRPIGGVPLDVVVNRLAPPVPVSWPAPPPRKDSLTLARELRAHIVADDIPAALAILRNAPHPQPRLLTHAAVHALLRVSDSPRAGALLLAYSSARPLTKPARMHPTTLEKVILALLKRVPKTQEFHEWSRTELRPTLLFLNPHMVSNSALRTALALYIQARKLFVRRAKGATALLWKILLAQREWVAAALVFDQQAKDYQLRQTLPALLRSPDSDPDAPGVTPLERDHLRRRLAILRIEDIRASRALFEDLCFRLGGVIHNITSRPESRYMSPAITAARNRAAEAKQAKLLDDEYSVHPTRFLDHDPDGAYGYARNELDNRYPYPTGLSRHQPKKPLTPKSAQRHLRVALQALTILGALVDSRQVPFADISNWITAVGDLPPSLSEFHTYAPRADGRSPARVPARQYLLTVLENYASALPRSPHIFSEFHIGTSGFIRRGLKHKLPEIASPTPEPDATLRTADTSPTMLEGYLGSVEVDGLTKRQRKRLRNKANREMKNPPTLLPVPMTPKRWWNPPDDPVEAADDSLMPPPPMATYEALLSVFLGGRGLVYESAPPMSAEAARANRAEAEAEAEAARDAEAEPESQADVMEARLQQHYHAPHSPNNPHPHIAYPPHPLDFSAYPPPVAPVVSPPQEALDAMRRRGALAACVVRHMMYERRPPIPPWESAGVMHLAARRREVFTDGLWDEMCAGAARVRRDAEMRESETRRIIQQQSEYSLYSSWGFAPQEQEGDAGRSMLRNKVETDSEGDLDALNASMVARARWEEEESYYGGLGRKEDAPDA